MKYPKRRDRLGKDLTAKQREDIKALIQWYEFRRLDWSGALEFLLRRYSGSLPQQFDSHRAPKD